MCFVLSGRCPQHLQKDTGGPIANFNIIKSQGPVSAITQQRKLGVATERGQHSAKISNIAKKHRVLFAVKHNKIQSVKSRGELALNRIQQTNQLSRNLVETWGGTECQREFGASRGLRRAGSTCRFIPFGFSNPFGFHTFCPSF